MKANRPLIIVGASGAALEVFFLAERLGLEIKGLLDDDPSLAGSAVLGRPILGCVTDWSRYSDCQFIVSIGNPRARREIVLRMQRDGNPVFPILIDPVALALPRHVTIGAGSIICAGATMTTAITIGEHVIINRNATIGHETRMGNFVTIAPMVAISGRVVLSHLVEVGTGASIRQGVAMAAGSMLGMGGVLIRNAAENELLVGNPAHLLRHLPPVYPINQTFL